MLELNSINLYLNLNNDGSGTLKFHEKYKIIFLNPERVLNNLICGLTKILMNNSDFCISLKTKNGENKFINFGKERIYIIDGKNKDIIDACPATYLLISMQLHNDIIANFNNWIKLFEKRIDCYKIKHDFFHNLTLLEHAASFVKSTIDYKTERFKQTKELTLMEVSSIMYNYKSQDHHLIFTIDLFEKEQFISIGKYYNENTNSFIYTINEDYENTNEYSEEIFLSALFNIEELRNIENNKIKYKIY